MIGLGGEGPGRGRVATCAGGRRLVGEGQRGRCVRFRQRRRDVLIAASASLVDPAFSSLRNARLLRTKLAIIMRKY